MRSSRFFLFVFAVVALSPRPARASDPQPYNIEIQKTGDAQTDESIAESSLLKNLRTKAPAPPFALVERARGDIGRIETVLNGRGYYKPSVSISIAGRDASDPDLASALDNVAQGTPVDVRVSIAAGPLYHLRAIDFDGVVPPKERASLGLSPGQPAIATDVLDAQGRLLAALQDDGYAFAKVDAPIATLDDDAHTLDLSFKIDAGPQSIIGAITLHGLKDMHEDFVRGTLTIHSGDSYRPGEIERARQGLLALGVFSGVSVRAGGKPVDGNHVALTFDIQERPRHAVALSANYSTDLGASVSASWSHRNLLGNAEQLNLSTSVTGFGGSASSGIGYNASAAFVKPRFLDEDQTLETDLAAVKQDLVAYNQAAETMGVYLRRAFSPEWNGSGGFVATHDEVAQEGTDRLYQLLALPLNANYDDTGVSGPLSDPSPGLRGSFSVTPTIALGRTSLTFLTMQASGSAYFDLSNNGQSIVALRALAGSVVGGSNFDLPPDQRLYAGGSATVRGFRYQSIGPDFADGAPAGATSVDAATIEFRQRFLKDWGAVAFVDAGQAGTNSLPFEGALNTGVGVGVRYYTSIGAVRADIAVPLNHVPQSDAFEIYIGLGQAF
jgi:translocation and assembly module TamA